MYKSFLLFCVTVSVAVAVDWCGVERKFCLDEKHILCNNTVAEFTGVGIKNDGAICQPFDSELIENFLKKLNTFRNDLAEGKISEYNKAKDMTKLEWNTEFAELAGENLRKIYHNNPKTCYKSSKNEELLFMERLPKIEGNTVRVLFEDFNNIEAFQLINLYLHHNFWMIRKDLTNDFFSLFFF